MSQSHRKSRRLSSKLNSSKPPTAPSISQLSFDVLGLIFEQARPDESKASDQADNKALSRFPYNLAAVCKQWREVLSLSPGYWVNPTFYVGSIDPTPLHDVRSFLEWSRDMRITVEVKRSPEAEVTNSDPHEGERTRAVIDALKPHVHRCLLITFDVIHGSSLPSISRDLFNVSPYLLGLTLRCKSDDGPPANLEKTGPVQELASQPNFLQFLLSGHTIHDAIENVPQIFKCLTNAQTLEFCCFDSEKYSESPTSNATDLFNAFKYPEALKLGTLHALNIPYETHPKGWPLNLPRAKNILLSDHNNTTMKTIFEHLDFRAVETLLIERCPLSNVSITGPRKLFLEGITSDLVKPLSSWRGSLIQLKDAPTATDTLLDLFIGQVGSSAVQHVYLHDCPNVSVNGLQRLCMMRKRPGFVPIMSLSVGGRAPEIDQEDADYLVALVGQDLTRETGFFEWKSPILESPDSFGDSLRPM
ncbi:hypothetical protein GALMADRAFT_207872 [Galerina marginata CBS 339.88]|uniref:F-box domain-containing protein n=1 Tax=Galerina marginata (strain CBS 339.88) TaxID=685588 RepID=A0A067TPU6_GALM3|nr:hypothetical protein GALMADRAFT_207872 [Galerina marginata CBS 339.88]